MTKQITKQKQPAPAGLVRSSKFHNGCGNILQNKTAFPFNFY
jgi:hypothetical protein